MKKLIFVWMLCVCIGFGMTAQASGTLFNAYLPKAILSEEEAVQEKIQMKPDMLKVVRQSVIPWDDEGTQWSVFIEVENESESKIVLDETWLIACNAEKEEFARWHVPAIDGAFWKTGRTVQPGGRVVLFAGTDEVRTWVQHPQTHEKTEKTVSPAGLSAFAGKIRRAKSLRMRLDTRIVSEAKEYTEQVETAKAWIADGKLHLETTDEFDPEGVVTLSVVVTDGDGRMLDAMQDSVAHNESLVQNGRFRAEKTLAPYVDEKTAQSAKFEITERKKPQKTVDKSR